MNGKMMDIVRAIVRPVVTVSGWLTILYLTIEGRPIDTVLFTTVVGFTSWWFAERAFGKRPQK